MRRAWGAWSSSHKTSGLSCFASRLQHKARRWGFMLRGVVKSAAPRLLCGVHDTEVVVTCPLPSRSNRKREMRSAQPFLLIALMVLGIGCNSGDRPDAATPPQAELEESSQLTDEPVDPPDSTEVVTVAEEPDEVAPPAEESAGPRVELLGVSPGDTFAKARQVLGRLASSSSDGSMGSPPVQYTWSFRTNQGRASIYSNPYPSQSQDQTPVSTVVLEADVNDYSNQVVRRLYDDSKAEYSRRYGQNRPDKFDLGAIEVYRWTWNVGDKKIEVEYQQENDMPYSTKVKVEV